MKGKVLVCGLVMILAGVLTGCSGDKEEKKQSALDQLTDKTVENIRKPMEESVSRMKSFQDAHMKAMEEAVGKGE